MNTAHFSYERLKIPLPKPGIHTWSGSEGLWKDGLFRESVIKGLGILFATPPERGLSLGDLTIKIAGTASTHRSLRAFAVTHENHIRRIGSILVGRVDLVEFLLTATEIPPATLILHVASLKEGSL